MSTRLERITSQRLESLSRIRERGIDPYPHCYHPSHEIKKAVALFERGEKAEKVSLAGRITARRKMGKMVFADIHDGSGKLQLCFRYDLLGPEEFELLSEIDIGDIIGAEGRLFRTKAGEITLEASRFTILCKSLRPLPEKWHGLVDVEKRYRQRYLDLISNEETREMFLQRSKIVAGIRNFLNSRGFVEVETPVLQPEAGGAAAAPFTTHYQALDRDFYLRIALELHLKRLIVGGFTRVYEMGRAFRNEGISTKHNPEFTLLECYQAYSDYNDMMTLVEELVGYLAREVLGKAEITAKGKIINLAPPWRRIYLRDAIKDCCGIDFEDYPDAPSLRAKMEEKGLAVDPRKGRGKLIDELISTFVEPELIQPTFLVDYPVEMSPLAKRKRGNERLVERFEGFASGMEVANAFTELNDPLDQRERFREQMKEKGGGEPVEAADEDFLEALEYGMPPTGGLGMGIDRLVMLLVGQDSIREVILFPQLKEKP